MSDRLPPFDEASEKMLLNCLLQDAKTGLISLNGQINSASFYDHKNRAIFSCISRMVSEDKPVDSGTVIAEFRSAGSLESAGGVPYLSTLDPAPLALAPFYAKKVADLFFRRKVIQHCAEVSEAAFAGGDVADLHSKSNGLLNGHSNLGGASSQFLVSELLDFDFDHDPNSVLGDRWLCKGGSCLWVGASGAGKSSLAMQAACNWAIGRNVFGIHTVRPLKSLFIQAENDIGDMAEMFNGVLGGMNMKAVDVPAIGRMLNENILIFRNTTSTGLDFSIHIKSLIEKHHPDLVWIDPLLAFFGDDISNQKACSTFLRNWISPISDSSGVIWMMMHHTNKPSTDKNARKGWTSTDYSYMGTGSSELTNWARATVILKQVNEEAYKLMFTKRGKRAGVKDMDGIRATEIYIQHADRSIFWEQIQPPDPEGEESKYDISAFIRQLSQEVTSRELTLAVQRFFRVKERKAYALCQSIRPRLCFNPESRTYSAQR